MNNTPKLRFKEFSGDWKEKKLSNYTEKITKKNKEFLVTNVISNSAKNGLVSQRDFFDKDIANQNNIDGYYIIENGDFVYNPRKSIESPYGPVNRYNLKDAGVVSPLYLCFKINEKINGKFLEYYFKSSKWYRFIYQNSDQGARHDRVSIKDSEFFKLDSKFPSKEEQDKIAYFFSLIDDKISLQGEKVEALKDYKKGIMQKIFSRELRFKNDDGRDYPEWEEKKLNQLGHTYTGLSGKTKENFGIGDAKYVIYRNVFGNILAKEEELDLVEINKGEKQNKVIKGDLLFTTSSETPEEVGMISCWNYDIEDLYLNSFCFGYRLFNLEQYSPIFMAYLLRSEGYRRKISILGQGSTRYNISKTELMKMKVSVPNIEEQRKIVSLLLSLESNIEKNQEKLDSLKEYKKGLLQQLFV